MYFSIDITQKVSVLATEYQTDTNDVPTNKEHYLPSGTVVCEERKEYQPFAIQIQIQIQIRNIKQIQIMYQQMKKTTVVC